MRRSDGGEGNRLIVQPFIQENRTNPWSIATYPLPDPDLEPDPDRVMAVNPERLFWRTTGALAYRAGGEHPVAEEHLLCTREHIGDPPPPPPKVAKPRGRPRKNPDDPKWKEQ